MLLAGLAGVCFFGSQATGGQLLGSANQISPASEEFTNVIDLTEEGTADWIFYEETATTPVGLFDHKIILEGTNQISDLSVYGNIGDYYDSLGGGTSFSWSDGTPNNLTAVAMQNTFANSGTSNGLQFTVVADTRTKYLKVYSGGYDGIITCTATLSDASAPPVSMSVDDSGDYEAQDYFTIQFAANSANQTLSVVLFVSEEGVTDGANTTVGLAAASLQIPPPAPAISIQPVSQTNYLTLAAPLNVVASGGLPLTYQWLQEANGVYVPLSDAGQFTGTTSNTLTINNLTSANATNYQVVVSNNWGAVTSSVANLTIMSQTGILIGTNPAARPRLT